MELSPSLETKVGRRIRKSEIRFFGFGSDRIGLCRRIRKKSDESDLDLVKSVKAISQVPASSVSSIFKMYNEQNSTRTVDKLTNFTF